MKNIGKQEIIFILKLLAYIAITYFIYIILKQYFIIDNCHPIIWWLWSTWYLCSWYLNFFDKSSIYMYVLFLWVTIIPFINIKYKLLNKIIFVGWIFIILLVIMFMYSITPTDFWQGLPLKFN